MGILSKSAASIGFYGDELEPAELTRLLGTEPTVGVSKGGTWQTSGGAEKTASIGSWRLIAERRAPGDLDGQINELLDRMADDFSAWRTLASRYRGRVFCGLFLTEGNEGLTLQASTVLRLAERGLQIDLDIYGPE
ncbi:MAG: hypothetical protein DI623_04855 [Sphingomonas sanxanigenens]|uniref:DUF4279 domain-containing protein n=1 Tax=Sphingomonas sanxanigenens TaxID=397260 RepID=A0A2W5AF92_9SPHN|nr:MAG: hypothetical protein DI623_04855 [Sphingomonas sanxanigenens]